MNAARFARSALRAGQVARPLVARRGYADVAADKIQLSLALPHQVCWQWHPNCLCKHRSNLRNFMCIHANEFGASSPSTSQRMCTFTSRSYQQSQSHSTSASLHALHSCIISMLTPFPLHSVQVNFAAESGEMGVLANHVPSIEQLKPGLVEVIEESGGSKSFFRAFSILPTSLRGSCHD